MKRLKGLTTNDYDAVHREKDAKIVTIYDTTQVDGQ